MPDQIIIDTEGRQRSGLLLTGDDLNKWEDLANELHSVLCGSLPHYPHEDQFGPPRCELIATHFVRHYKTMELRDGTCVTRSSQRRAAAPQHKGEK
jgi:hypothetical protein